MRAVLPVLATFVLSSAAAAEPVDFIRDVKPLLAKHCAGCHGPTKQRAGLRLDTAAAALRGSDSGAVIVVGKSAQSKLIHAVTGTNDAAVMPPKEPRLDTRQVAILRSWIDQGAKAPAGEVEAVAQREAPTHWAFRPPVRPALPAVKDPAWCRNPVDRFILAALEAKGLRPSPEAEPVTLLRRVSLDLTGLPPSVAEVDAFLQAQARDSNAYGEAIERLLASPHYGERWGRHWLDAARYADSNGYNFDAPRSIWKYRDWVIGALNRDLPFDRFVVEQLAGDLLPGATLDQQAATGFHRNSMFNDEGGTDPEQSRVEGLVDRVGTTGSVFLGLTIACCQCHDHKYDPLTQRDFYRLYAFFNSSDDGSVEFASPAEFARRDALKSQLAAAQQELKSYTTLLTWVHLLHPKAATPAARNALKTCLAVPVAQRQASHVKQLDDYFTAHDAGLRERKATIAALQRQMPSFVTTLTMRERPQPRDTFIHVRGDFLRKGARVPPGTPAILTTANAPGSGSRLDLARWIASPSNPLTARVLVNRVWQQYFGLGIVETENDFGVQCTPPSHPELLDWLATEFVARGWSLKELHRSILTSATYRQASRHRPELADLDQRNRLLGRQNRLRLEAEVIRDVSLASSGLLTRAVGGPSVFPPQPDGLDAYARSKKNWRADTGPNRYRRGMYTHFWRSLPHPGLVVFDTGDATTSCTRRPRSTTPLQALTLANDLGYYECAQALTGRVLRQAPPSDSARIRHAFRLCLAREPTADEAALLTTALAGQRANPEVTALPAADRDRAAWTTVARTLLNLDEFITRE